MPIIHRLRRGMHLLWWMARQISGDAAYENYLRSATTPARGEILSQQLMSADKFYEDSLRRRYSQASRCC